MEARSRFSEKKWDLLELETLLFSIVFFFFGSLIEYGWISLGSDSHGIFGTTYLSYYGTMRSITLTTIGAILASSILVFRYGGTDSRRIHIGNLFLCLLFVNIVRIITFPPDWRVLSSGFTSDMLVPFEALTTASHVLIIISFVALSLTISQERYFSRTVRLFSKLVILLWLPAVFYLLLLSIAGSHYLGLGLSVWFRTVWILFIGAFTFTAVLLVMDYLTRRREIKSI